MRYIAAIFLGLSLVANAQADELVTSKTVPMTVQIVKADGLTTERKLVVKYEAFVAANVWETGHPMVPSKGWFTDTRQCHLELTSYVNRTVVLVDEVFGKGSRVDNATRKIIDAQRQDAQPFSFDNLKLQGDNCNKVGRYRAQIGAARNRLVNDFDAVIAADKPILLAELAEEAKTYVVYVDHT